jgi:plasmid stabilization system protein ParE
MKVRFTRPALDDLSRIHAYISKDNPAAASRVVTRLIDRAWEIAHAPYQGREVDEPNTRVVVIWCGEILIVSQTLPRFLQS